MNIFSKIRRRICNANRIRKISKYCVFNTPKKNIKILGDCYVFGTPKIIFNGKCTIFPNVSFAGDGEFNIGNNVGIGKGCSLYASKSAGVSIGNDIGIGANTYIIDCDHGIVVSNMPMMDQPHKTGPIKIANNVWIACNCVVLRNTVLEEGVVVAAGSVIKGQTKANSIYTGVPARFTKERPNE